MTEFSGDFDVSGSKSLIIFLVYNRLDLIGCAVSVLEIVTAFAVAFRLVFRVSGVSRP
jgi:hypothetical protein